MLRVRKPTEAMVRAYIDVQISNGSDVGADEPAKVWQVMIDAAMGEHS